MKNKIIGWSLIVICGTPMAVMFVLGLIKIIQDWTSILVLALMIIMVVGLLIGFGKVMGYYEETKLNGTEPGDKILEA